VRNHEWWEKKIQRNRDRDVANDQRLIAEGWSVLRFWEHDDVDDVVEAVKRRVAELPRC
jgi:DNA mismatch endonuclease (patch repair protein)